MMGCNILTGEGRNGTQMGMRCGCGEDGMSRVGVGARRAGVEVGGGIAYRAAGEQARLCELLSTDPTACGTVRRGHLAGSA